MKQNLKRTLQTGGLLLGLATTGGLAALSQTPSGQAFCNQAQLMYEATVDSDDSKRAMRNRGRKELDEVLHELNEDYTLDAVKEGLESDNPRQVALNLLYGMDQIYPRMLDFYQISDGVLMSCDVPDETYAQAQTLGHIDDGSLHCDILAFLDHNEQGILENYRVSTSNEPVYARAERISTGLPPTLQFTLNQNFGIETIQLVKFDPPRDLERHRAAAEAQFVSDINEMLAYQE